MMTRFGFPISATSLIRKSVTFNSDRKAFPILSLMEGESAELRVTKIERVNHRACIRAIVTKASNEEWVGRELVLIEGSFVANKNPHIQLARLQIGDILKANSPGWKPILTLEKSEA